MISVIIPVGPESHHTKWLDYCLESIKPQLKARDEIFLIDDMANLNFDKYSYCRIFRTPWRCGCATAWNFGISLASNDLCLMMGADDWLAPEALEQCAKKWNSTRDFLGYYGLVTQYYNEKESKFEEVQSLPCNAAFVHKKLWMHTGGFPPEVGIGAPDAAFISILLGQKGKAGNIHKVGESPLYFVRRHSNQDTAQRGAYQGAILDVRNILTGSWEHPKWGRYEP